MRPPRVDCVRSGLAALLLASISMAIAAAQPTRIDLARQAQGHRPIPSGDALPLFCETGELFFLASSPPGLNLYGCTAARAWALQAGGSGGSMTISVSGQVYPPRPRLDFLGAYGLLLASSDTGQAIVIEPAADTGEIVSHGQLQSGESLLCASAGGSASAFTCEMQPRLGFVALKRGLVVHWIPDAAGAGAITLDIDMLGAKPVKMPDGVTNPTAADVQPGRLYLLWYDGVRFRMVR